jgi:hypothetical protein
MSDTPTAAPVPGLSAAESEKMQAALKDIAQRSQKLLQDFAKRYEADGPQPADPRPSWTSPPKCWPIRTDSCTRSSSFGSST